MARKTRKASRWIRTEGGKFTVYAGAVRSYRARVNTTRSCRHWLLALVCGFAVSASAAAPGQPLVIPDYFECPRATGVIKVDGKADEPAWAKAVVIQSFVTFWQNRPGKTKTKARLLWDDEYLYFHAEMEDADLYADERQTNGRIWENDVFELFFKPSEQKNAYYEFQINPLNAQFHTFLPSRGYGGMRRALSQPDDGKFNLKTAVVLDGTLNNWHDDDKGWSVEGRIPWKDFHRTGGAPKLGDVWRFALCRYDYSKNFEQPDLTSCAPLAFSSFHRYEDYCRLKFVTTNTVADAGKAAGR